jgi:hypothetical protein
MGQDGVYWFHKSVLQIVLTIMIYPTVCMCQDSQPWVIPISALLSPVMGHLSTFLGYANH